MRKINGKSNIAGKYIEKVLEENNMTKESLCQKLQLSGINILYRIINGSVNLKDFELNAICKILEIDFNNLQNLIDT